MTLEFGIASNVEADPPFRPIDASAGGPVILSKEVGCIAPEAIFGNMSDLVPLDQLPAHGRVV
jgi:hypothetical protein